MNRITLITIGDELLRGRVVNTNASEAGKMLQEAGFPIGKVVSIGDDGEAIRNTLQAEAPLAEILILCGGLGPTRDDITKHTLAGLIGRELVMHDATLEHLEARYRQRGRVLNELTRLQALVIEDSEVIYNRLGTAPGLGIQLGTTWVVALPGVPYEFLNMLTEEVLPRLHQRMTPARVSKRLIRMEGLPESTIAELIAPFESDFPEGMYISYLPRIDGMWLELILPREDPHGELAAWHEKLARQFEQNTFALDDTPIPALLKKLLLEKELTLAVAESLTGGRVGNLIVSESGSSEYFLGGMTTYATPLKTDWLNVPAETIEKFGVVSAEVALAMAKGVAAKSGASIGIATTGLAETDGVRPPQAWVACVGPGFEEARLIGMYGERVTNQERSAYQALVLLLKNLQPELVATAKFG